ncbi:hypothetical protein B0H14DRAFT_2637452 [Mycena olivaceomarginata]|nr:hypothetical protein B0H14DRAFT_2637452 [Mycena olivaceomarginata]
MSSKCKPGFEIVHSGTWWKDFHAARRERQARAANGFSPNAPNSLTGTTYTFVPGQDAPIVTVAGAPVRPVRKSAPSWQQHHPHDSHPAGETGPRADWPATIALPDRAITAPPIPTRGHIRMARAGYLGDVQNFVAQTDEEILAYLKMLRGRELLAASREQSTQLAQECRQKAIAAALPVRRIPRP